MNITEKDWASTIEECKMRILSFSNEAIVGLIPAQAIIDFDRAREVLEKVAQKQAELTRDEIIEWGNEFCVEHHSRPFPKSLGGGIISKARRLRRRQCPECWKDLLKWL